MLGVSSHFYHRKKKLSFVHFFSLHSQIVDRREEQNLIIEKVNTIKYNHHRTMYEEDIEVK